MFLMQFDVAYERMKNMKVHLLEPLGVSDAFIQELAEPIHQLGHEFVYYDEKTQDNQELIDRSKEADVVMIANNPYPQEVVEALKKTQLINVAFTGVDHVGLQACKDKGIQVANASGYANQAVAELAIGLALELYRQISQSDKDIRLAEDFPGSMMGREIKGKTVGIIGTGSIGLETAQLFKAFDCKLIAYNRSEKAEARELGIEYRSLDDLLRESDIVSIHLPLNDETKNLISDKEFDLMKDSAILVNLARGPIVDTQALVKALNEDKIAGAAIDVYDQEPPLPQDHLIFQAKNTILTPHIGFLTQEAMERRAKIAFDNTLAFLQGQAQNIVKL